MNTYKVLSNLRHDGEVYKKGDTIDIDKTIGEPLVRDGVLADKNAKDEDDAVPLAPREKKDKKPVAKKGGKGSKKNEKEEDKEETKVEDEDDTKDSKKSKDDDKSDEL